MRLLRVIPVIRKSRAAVSQSVKGGGGMETLSGVAREAGL